MKHMELSDDEPAPRCAEGVVGGGRGDGVAEVYGGYDLGIESRGSLKSSNRLMRMKRQAVLTREPMSGGGVRGAGEVAGGRVSVDVRQAGRDDALALAVIEGLTFCQEDRFRLAQIHRLIANPRARVTVAEHNDRVVGWLVALTRTHKRWRTGRIYGVAVDPSMMGRGVGRTLLVESLAAMEGMGIGRVYLEVRADNETAIGLYQSLGFRFVVRLADYYGEGGTGIRMRRVVETATRGLVGG